MKGNEKTWKKEEMRNEKNGRKYLYCGWKRCIEVIESFISYRVYISNIKWYYQTYKECSRTK